MATEGATGVTSLPAWTPAIVRRHPALLVEWLRLVNMLSRWREQETHAAVLVVSAVALLAALLTALSGHVAAIIEILARYWVLAAVTTAIYGMTSVTRRRRDIEESQSQSWLIATPISPVSLRLSHAIRTFLPVFVLLLFIAMFSTLAAFMNSDITVAAATVVAAAGGGLLAGSVAGWWAAGRGRELTDVAASRYVPRPRILGALRPDAAALARWPIAQVLSWSRPENSRYVLIVALLAVQGGSSALAGLAVVATYFLASYLAALLSAMLTVAKAAATWLRATPMTLGEFVWALSRRALAQQMAGTALAVGFMMLLGAPPGMALQIAALWLGLVISICGSALIDNYRGRSPFVKIALSVAVFAAFAAILQLRAGARA